jgi:Trp operon repressor
MNEREKLILLLNEKLKNVKTGDDIREVFFTIIEQHLTPDEIEKVFLDVKISDELLEEIEKNDNSYKR